MCSLKKWKTHFVAFTKAGADALGTGNYERAQTAIEHARRVMLLCEKIAALKGEWKDVEGTFSVHEAPEQQTPLAASVQRQTSMTYCSCKTTSSCAP